MKLKFATVMAIAVLMVSGSLASERGARLIDTIGVEMWEFDKATLIGGSLWGETQLESETLEWAIVAGITYGQLSLDAEDASTPLWTGNLGIKYYISDLSSFQVTVGYGQMTDLAADVDLSNLKATFKQRILPASEHVSPYLSAGFMYQREDYELDEDATDLYVELHMGAEFAARKDLAFIFDVGMIQSLDDADETFDSSGVTAGFFMKYYWD